MQTVVFIIIALVGSVALALGELVLLHYIGSGTEPLVFSPERWTQRGNNLAPSLHEHAEEKLHKLQQALGILEDKEVEALFVQALKKRSQLAKWRSFLITAIANAISIIVGWLLSGLVSPTALLTHLHF